MGLFDSNKMTRGGVDWDLIYNSFLDFCGIQITNKADANHTHGAGGVVFTICTSATRPSSPTLGMFISETDTGNTYKCTSTSPVVWTPLGALDYLLADTGATLNTYVLTPTPAITAYNSTDTYYMLPRAGSATRTCSVASARVFTTTSSSAVVNLTTGTTTGLANGMVVAGTGITGGSTILSIQSLTQFTMNQISASAQSGQTLTVTKAITCTIASNNAFTVTSGTTANLLPGMPITGTGILAGCTVASVIDSTHFTSTYNCTAGSGIAVTVTIPVVEMTLDSGNTTGLTSGWLVDGVLTASRDTTIASIVDTTHLLLSAVPNSGSAQVMSFNNGRNTGAATVNINGLGTKSLVLADGSALLTSYIRAGGIYILKYNSASGSFMLLNPSTTIAPTGATAYNNAGAFTFTQGVDCPASVTRIYAQVWGGGGGGGNTDADSSYGYGGGGGGGGYSAKWITLTAGQAVTITVGAGGTIPGYSYSNPGGTSSFGAYISATGGGGGNSGNSGGGQPGAGGTGSGGDVNATGASGSGSNGGAGANGGAGGIYNSTGPQAPGGGGAGGHRDTCGGQVGAAGRAMVQW